MTPAHPRARPTRPAHRLLSLLLGLGLCLSASTASALVRGTSPTGVVYASGGGSYEELDQMRAERQRYSFWLTTAVRGSGAYLADVKVRISDEAGRRVLDHTMDGPWLFADLPLGRFEVEAFVLDERTGRLEVQRGTVTIHPGDHHRMVLYFNADDDGAGERGAASGSPYERLR
ncbi:MAG TPA: hypothetical protein VLE94_08620 [Burkholderiaceae bacterium]|nr:hypothetical protein [Burkholderiaceae bacterium]